MTPPPTHRFTHALLRRPPRSCTDGLRAVDVGAPDAAVFAQQHETYARALQRAGLLVTTLPALEPFPDSAFVEDTALCLPEGAVILRPGADSRRGETDAIAPALERLYGPVGRIDEGTIDGGDILVTDSAIFVGRSQRTDAAGIKALTACIEPWGYRVRAVQTPPGVLHLKSDCAPLGGDRVLSTGRLADSGLFDDLDVLIVPEGEEAAANALRINDTVFVARGFESTAALLTGAGYSVVAIDISEAARLDAGLSCLSLRFTLPGSGGGTSAD